MFEPLTIPLGAPTGVISALFLLFAFTIGHAFADFPLQGDFLSRGKNRNAPPPPLADGKVCPTNLWVYLMSAHCLIHAGFVWVIGGYAILAVAEFILHWMIDAAKCEGHTSFATDQWLHIITKAAYVAILWSGILHP
jgi:Protein of unknown function (DUF3307)